ncbi:type II-A CRISPR-associated protein Csn2 [uncultured Limosilactobacillus sp.]|uniref:type II-A CRISPR-associated protein Csn2 n=1 Tax=uncultured Limosilactobacillus sp. TaxID=2837629 RepID=UPI0025DF348B|nr:type II-A CRISPR-associated protein Csn2 [uncultured Limosilactobacillus sp.]
MKVVYETHQTIDVKPGKITVLATNNQTVYLELIRGMKDMNESIHFYDDDYKEVDHNKAMDWDGDVVADLSLEKTYSTEIIKYINQSLTDEERRQLDQAGLEFYTAIQDKLLMVDIPLEVSFDGDIKRMMKYAQIHFPKEINNDPYGIIEADLKIHLECDDQSIIGLTNVAHYLTLDQISHLVEINDHLQTKVLLVEFTESRNQDAYPNCDYYYIDEDFVDWGSN